MKAKYHIGTSGWNYRDWRGRFYPADLPAKRWLEYYVKAFDTVEINNTFYHLPAPAIFTAWHRQAPKKFLFAVKANRFITHIKRLKEPKKPLGLFLRRARRLGPALGPILYQLPPYWKPDLERLKGFCRALPRDLTHVIEFRDRAWLTREVFDVLSKHRVCLCVHDMLGAHPRLITGTAAYIRFHGVGAKYGGNYSRSNLRQWANWMRTAAEQVGDVYAYFNNDRDAHAIGNAQTLRDILGID